MIYPCPANCGSTCGCPSCTQMTYPHTVTIPAAEYARLLAAHDLAAAEIDRLRARVAELEDCAGLEDCAQQHAADRARIAELEARLALAQQVIEAAGERRPPSSTPGSR